MNESKNYSIIIPHKNIPELLQRCLDSIPRREDVQVIVIDDNSDPGIVDFEKFPGLGDPFVEVIFKKKGKGAGYARNEGLVIAIGKWILFADADDYFSNNFLQYLDNYVDSHFDLIYFGINGIDAGTEKENSRGKEINRLMFEAINNQEYDTYKYGVWEPFGKIIKRSIVNDNNIKFDETMVINDMMFSLKVATLAKNIHFDANKIYTYEKRPASLISMQTLEVRFDRLYVWMQRRKFIKSIGKKENINILIPLLLRLFSIQNINYFFNGIVLFKTNKINIFIEFWQYCLSKLFGRVNYKIVSA